jgi:pimeloyl-ACP methyl ester carboxylesterase
MKLAFKKYGEGDPLVILHGLYGSSDNWVSIGRKLAEHYTVYLVDQRNHGKSPHVKEHSFDAMADDLLSFMKNEGLTKVYLAGHSMGGKTAMLFAAKYPNHVKKLLVLDISPKSHNASGHNNTIFQQHHNILTALNNLNLNDFSARKEIDSEISKNIASKGIRQFILKNLKRDQQDHFSWKINVHVLYDQLNEILSDIDLEPYRDNLATIPALFVNGGNSGYLTEADKPYLQYLFTDILFKTVDGAGHWVHAEAPDSILKIMKEFIG